MRMSAHGQDLTASDTILGPGDARLAAPPSHIASQLVQFGSGTGTRPDISRMSSMPNLGNNQVSVGQCNDELERRCRRQASVALVLTHCVGTT